MIMARIRLAYLSIMMTAALSLVSCANDAGQSGTKNTPAAKTPDSVIVDMNNAEQPAKEPTEEPPQYAQVGPDVMPKNKPSPKNAGEVIEIKEKMFIAQTNEIYINARDYLGRTIRYEGVFHETKSNGATYRFVIRYGPGCCPGDVAAAGFEVVWDKPYPKHNDWVEAAGVLEEYDDGGPPALRLALKSLTVLEKRGKEKVTQ